MPLKNSIGALLNIINEDRKPETQILDKFDFSLEHYLPRIKQFITVAKIGWGIPLLFSKDELKARVKAYHKNNVLVSTGGTLTEIAYRTNTVDELFPLLKSIGFDIIEVSDGSIHLPLTERARLIRLGLSYGFTVVTEVGKKKRGYYLSLEQMLRLIHHDLATGASKVIIEARETGKNTCLFNEDGSLKKLLLHRLVREIPLDKLIFEAPLPINQVQLIKELGDEICLSNVNVRDVINVQTYRYGLRGDTFFDTAMREPQGGPSLKFVYYLLKEKGPINVDTITRLSRLPKRTVHEALRLLYKDHLVGVEKGEDNAKIWFAL